MGLLGSAFGRGLAGAGEAAVDIGNKYLDANIQNARMQLVADIQRQTAGAMRADEDAFRNDPTRVARDRANKVADITAEGTARTDVDIAGKKKLATDPELLAADVERTSKITSAQATASANAQVDAELRKITNPAWIDAKRKEALATHIESAGSIAQAQLAQFQLGQARNIAGLRQQLAEAQSTGDKIAADDIQSQIDAIEGKGGKVDKFYAVAEKASAAMAPAVKILNDPMATADAKEEANTIIRQQRMLMESAAKRAGVDLSAARYAPPPQPAIEALKKSPDKAADFDAKFGPGAAAKILGGAPAASTPVPAAKPPAAPAPPPQSLEPINPDSFVGRARAQAAQREQQRTQQAAQQQQEAQSAYASLQPGDKASAARLQASPLFGLLTPEQQRDIYNRVNAR